MFWKRANARGAMACLIAGFVLGMGRLAAEVNKSRLPDWLHWFATINFRHFAIGLFLVGSAILVVVSFTSRAATREQLAGLTYATVEPGTATGPEAASAAQKRALLWLTATVLAAVGAVWFYFSG